MQPADTLRAGLRGRVCRPSAGAAGPTRPPRCRRRRLSHRCGPRRPCRPPNLPRRTPPARPRSRGRRPLEDDNCRLSVG
eukprot:scaffold18845_cov56-Phaeocystis_antarctica.AAC.3